MSNTGRARILWTAFAALLLGACGGVEDIPVVPEIEPADAPIDRSPRFPSQTELKLCDRRVPPPRC